MADPFLEVLEDHEWLHRVATSKHPAAKAFTRYLTHEVLPAATRGRHEDDGTLNQRIADLFIKCPEFRPANKDLN